MNEEIGGAFIFGVIYHGTAVYYDRGSGEVRQLPFDAIYGCRLAR
jgi:hypothetical protein